MSKDRQTSDSANSGIGVSPVLNQAPKDRKQNGFHSGGASGESAGSARGQQQQGSGSGDASVSDNGWGGTSGGRK